MNSLPNLATDGVFDLLNQWQKEFPLVDEPFAVLAQQTGRSVADVLQAYRGWQKSGELSRVGGVFNQAAGGASLLAAMAVPVSDLERVATIVSSHPGVNHNYEREHEFNLWFVMTGRDTDQVEAAMRDLDGLTGLQSIRLPMVRPYRIDLAFDLRNSTAAHRPVGMSSEPTEKISDADIPLAGLVEEGLPIVERPFDVWAARLNWPTDKVIGTILNWLGSGVLRRFGNVVRHHELGFTANAMTVFDIPQPLVDTVGQALAIRPEITLAYQRKRAPGWPYNLYCMIHGRDREAIERLIRKLVTECRLDPYPRAVLFSLRRFKQVGASRFREAAHAQS